ncbi:MAG: PDZ domain-containing protein, partial [Planctomycetes bacterium]|nr:PDZ domain-containing protein [Planctomycetota bacterium]
PERIILASMCCGVGRFALKQAVGYARERVVFDAPIGAHQGLQHPLAKARTAVELASLMTRKAAWTFDQGLPAGEASNMAKYSAAEAGIEAGDLIRALAGEQVADFQSYAEVLRTLKVGQQVTVRVRREGAEVDLQVKVGARSR